MADPEINIAVKADTSQAESALKHLENTAAGAAGTPADTQGTDTLAAGIGRLADACEKGAERLQKLNLGYLHDQFDELKSINTEMGGLGNALDDFGTRLADISTRQAETAEGFRSLQAELTRLSEAYTSGKISADEAAAAFAELTDCARAQLATDKQLCADMRSLAGEQRSLSESKREELPVYREMQAAAKEELAAFEATSEKKAQLRALEKASLDELYQKVEAYEAKAATARTSGNAASELEAAKAIEATIKAIEKKEATQQRADQAAQAGLERTKRAIVLQHASVERLAGMYDAVRQKYLEAKQAQDVQGEARYLQYAKQVSDALNKKREEADRAARALEQSAKAAEKEAAAQTASAQQMKLSSMKARELTAEIERLSAARKEAAAAGNVSDYEKLTDDLVRAKKALSEYNNEVNIGKTALLNKAQAGMMAAQQLGGLAQQVRSGTVDMASMASAIMSVSMALKAGLGPIGWAMAAVQGLQMAWDWFSDSQEKAEAAEQQREESLAEAERRHAEALDALAAAQRKLLLDDWSRQTEELKREGEELAAANARTRAATEAAAQREDAAARQAAEARAAAERDALELMQVRGELGAKEAEDRLRRVEERKQAELAAIEAAAAARQNANERAARDDAARQADALEQALAETYGKFENVLKVQMPTEQEWNVLQAKLDAGRQSLAEMRFSEQVHRDADEVRRVLAELGVHVAGGTQDILAFLDNVRAAKAEGERDVQALRQQADAHAEGARAALAEREALAAQHAEEQRAAAARQGIADAREEQRRVEEEWADVSRRSLAEQQEWLTAQIAQVQEGSELWKKYNDKLESVNRSRVGEELSRLESDLKTSTNYARQSGKTQAQVYREDLRILQEKEKQLEQLRTAPGIDAKTEERINRALQSTREQISGLKSAMVQSATNARRWIRETEPPKLQGKNKVVQGALDRLAKTYRLTAARAAKAAEKGDWKAYERAMRTMGNAGKNMGKLAKDSKQVAGYTGGMKTHVKAIANAARSGARSEKEAAKAAKQKAGAQRQAAAAIEKQRPKEKVEDAAQKIAELSSKMNSAQRQMERLSQQVAALQGAIGGLASAAGSAADAAGNVASAANSAIKSVERRIKACEKSIDKLRR